MKKKTMVLMFFTVAPSLAASSASAYDLIPLWESRSVSTTATFYTTYLNDNESAMHNDGHEQHGIAAWVPCSLDTLNGPNGEISYKGSTMYPDVPSGD